MNIVLIHGMGRTPLSMAWLALRLRLAGHRVSLFGYNAARESFVACSTRLARQIMEHSAGQPYAVIGHSLGTVLLRQALSQLQQQPHAAFLLAPPTQACAAARFFAASAPYRFFTGEMGQLLASAAFMQQLPPAPANTLIFAGTACMKNGVANDGILSLAETRLPGVPCLPVNAWHTFIMNNRLVFRQIRLALKATR